MIVAQGSFQVSFDLFRDFLAEPPCMSETGSNLDDVVENVNKYYKSRNGSGGSKASKRSKKSTVL